MIWEIFSHQKRGKKGENSQIGICGFHCVAKNIEGWLKICSLFVVYSQDLLNLPKGDRHFLLLFKWMIATLATNRNSLQIFTNCSLLRHIVLSLSLALSHGLRP
jgi:hypothetical protein